MLVLSEPAANASRCIQVQALRRWDAQVQVNLSRQLFLNIAVSRNCSHGTVHRIRIDGVLTAFTNKEAKVRFKVPDEVGSFHLCCDNCPPR